MKTSVILLSASVLFSSVVLGEVTAANQERSTVQNEIQNRFHTMSTDELLQKRGSVATQQEREQLHNELMNRQQSMTQEQNDKFMGRPENRTPKMKNQGSGQGMMQGSGMGSGSGMGGGMMGGGGKGGR